MNIRIILADDHKILREGLRALLDRHKGFEVVGEADGGIPALRLAKEHEPDVIVLDITMPDMNGVDVARKLTNEDPRIKVVALSVHSDMHYVARMFAAGARGYLRKDCASKELVHAINTVVKGEIYLSPLVANRLPRELIRQIEHEQSIEPPMLTPRELEVLQLVAQGKTTREIATQLDVTPKAIEKHRENIMDKLQLHTIADLTKYAISHGIILLEK